MVYQIGNGYYGIDADAVEISEKTRQQVAKAFSDAMAIPDDNSYKFSRAKESKSVTAAKTPNANYPPSPPREGVFLSAKTQIATHP